MGTDVFLRWSGMDESDVDRQAGVVFSTMDGGGVGYLRASIWMDAENEVLMRLFPVAFRDGSEVFDFGESFNRFERICEDYVDGDGGTTSRLEDRMVWVRSLVEFYRLGWRKQLEGCEVRVIISR